MTPEQRARLIHQYAHEAFMRHRYPTGLVGVCQACRDDRYCPTARGLEKDADAMGWQYRQATARARQLAAAVAG